MDGVEWAAYQKLDAIIQTERFKALDRVQESNAVPDRLDLLLLTQWRAELAAGQGRGPKSLMKQYGPHWSAAGGIGVIVAWGIEVIGRLVGG